VNFACAASFIAAVGNTNRFMTSCMLVAYLGLDPGVKQSGEEPAPQRPISKRGSPAARCALVEAAWTAVLQPGLLHAFYARVRARKGHGKAIVATARKLAVPFWCMLTRGEDYAHQQPSLTRKKLRRLEITAGAPKYTRRAAGIWSTNDLMRTAELELACQVRGADDCFCWTSGTAPPSAAFWWWPSGAGTMSPAKLACGRRWNAGAAGSRVRAF
jgi:hypothetical protein